MNKTAKIISVLASLSLLTGCAGLNNSSSSSKKASSSSDCCADKNGSDVPDCCGDGSSDCCDDEGGSLEKSDTCICFTHYYVCSSKDRIRRI